MLNNKKGLSFGTIVAVFGSILIAVGVAWLIAQNWHQLPPVVKILILLAATSAAYISGTIFRVKGHQGISKSLLILGALLYKCDDKENYKACVCSSNNGGRRENCQDVDLVDTAYNSGVLTEYTNLVAPGWSTVSPGDYDFPEDAG